MREPPHIKINPSDNVIVVLADTHKGIRITDDVVSRTDIPVGHKIACQSIEKGKPILKYGQIIGTATRNIDPGEHVHTHNVDMVHPDQPQPLATESVSNFGNYDHLSSTFTGIQRADGSVGTRNFIGILSSVNCSASVASFIAKYFNQDRLASCGCIDGVVALTHGMGCGDSATSQGFQNLQRCLAGFCRHPNFGGVLMVGLGCEVLQADAFSQQITTSSGTPVEVLNIQNIGGTRRTVEKGIEMITAMLPEVNRFKRKPLPVSHLTLGLECGGSDAFSGLTANPALGAAIDILVAKGGTAILGETPEIYGTEQFLARRAIRPEVGHKILDIITWWQDYTRINGSEINNNPSPGNKAGGLTTILEKALGAVVKAGTSPLMDAYEYAAPVRSKGLVFMNTPGYDPVSITGMVAGGANLICFTTGRGSVLGCKPVPVVKLTSNTQVYTQLAEDMDIDCGPIAEGSSSVPKMGAKIYEHIIETASGKPTKSEIQGIGDLEFVPWQIGAVL